MNYFSQVGAATKVFARGALLNA